MSEWLPWFAAIAGPIIGYIIATRNSAKVERDHTIAQMAAITTKMDMFTQMIADFKQENRDLAHKASVQLDIRSDSNAALTKEAVVQAKMAFVEANTVNKKIEKIGLTVADGTKLNPNEPEH